MCGAVFPVCAEPNGHCDGQAPEPLQGQVSHVLHSSRMLFISVCQISACCRCLFVVVIVLLQCGLAYIEQWWSSCDFFVASVSVLMYFFFFFLVRGHTASTFKVHQVSMKMSSALGEWQGRRVRASTVKWWICFSKLLLFEYISM